MEQQVTPQNYMKELNIASLFMKFSAELHNLCFNFIHMYRNVYYVDSSVSRICIISSGMEGNHPNSLEKFPKPFGTILIYLQKFIYIAYFFLCFVSQQRAIKKLCHFLLNYDLLGSYRTGTSTHDFR